MKKITLLAIVVIAASLGSCKKDYTCECTIPASGSTPASTYNYELKNVKKKDAKDACNSAGNVWILAGGTCAIK
jgi:hypothetical protein